MLKSFPKTVEALGLPNHAVAFVLLLTDIVIIFSVAVSAWLIRHVYDGNLDPAPYFRLMPLLLLFPVASFTMGLYQSVPLPPPCELKRLSLATGCTYLAIAIFIFFTKNGDLYSRLTFALSGLGSLAAVPIARHQVRQRMARHRWWTSPAILFGKPDNVQPLARILLSSPSLGLRPVALTADGRPMQGEDMDLPLFDANSIRLYAKQNSSTYGIVVLESYPESDRMQLVDHLSHLFQNIILLPSSSMVTSNIWLSPIELGGLPGLLVRQNLLDPRRLMTKRVLDLVMTLLVSLIALPLMLLIALCIKLETPGPALFTQQRLGHGGRHFSIVKFRTMYANAEEKLAECLAQSEEMRLEWKCDQKLRCDPRVTKVGAFLRKTSLDELPQIWNVLSGDMSFVGPRPIVDNEIPRYGAAYEIYKRVRPGITGLWQVSGRNDLSYAERVRRDRYYICNWSVWFDIWILAKTVPATLCRHGAY